VYTYIVYSCDTHAWHVDTPYYPEYDSTMETITRDGFIQPEYLPYDGKFRMADRNEHYGDVPEGIILNIVRTPPPDDPYLEDDLPF
jgi:hypothetical protein